MVTIKCHKCGKEVTLSSLYGIGDATREAGFDTVERLDFCKECRENAELLQRTIRKCAENAYRSEQSLCNKERQ